MIKHIGSKRKHYTWLIFVIMWMSFCLIISKIYAVEFKEDSKCLKIGYIGYDGFIDKNTKGEHEGYAVEYLEEISKYTGFKYEYVYTSWSQALEMLKERKLDLICNANFSMDRNKIYDYSRCSFGTLQSVLYTRGDNNLYYNDFEKFNNKKIGVIQDSMIISFLDAYAKKNNFTYEKVLYGNYDKMVDDMLKGEVDVIATENMAKHNGLKLIGNFASEPLYLMSYKGNNIMDDIDQAIDEINTKNLNYKNELFYKYYGENMGINDGHFTREESEYIKELLQHKKKETGKSCLNVAINVDLNPMAFIEEGEIKGIETDILKEVSTISGIPFQFVPLTWKAETYNYKYFVDNNVDIFMLEDNNINRAYSNERKSGIKLTNPFVVSKKVFVAKKGFVPYEHKQYKIAIVGGSSTLPKLINQYYGNAEIVPYESLEKCFDMVNKGEADFLIYNQYLVERQLLRPQYSELSMVPNKEIQEAISLSPLIFKNGDYKQIGQAAVDKYLDDERLISIINKSIHSIPKEKVDRIIIENTIGSYSTTLKFNDFLYKYKYPTIALFVATIIVILLIILLYFIKRKNYERIKNVNLCLEKAVKEAQQANMAKSQFLSHMSHEIRTPMNAIVGLIHIAKDHKEEWDKTEDYLNRIESSSKVLLNLINDVLDMSAIESSKMKVSKTQFGLKDILINLEAMYSVQCNEKGIRFEMIDEVKDMDTFIGDPLRVNQILINLISNAYKFTEPGGEIKVKISKSSIIDSNVFIRFEVCDTGVGMTRELMNRVFKPFEQEDAETAQKYGGSGLGLSIAKNLVDMMHGSIKVNSEKGVGTKFIVDIPFEYKGSYKNELKNTCNTDKTDIKNNLHEKKRYDFQGKRILVVEDNELNSEIAKELLQLVNIKVECATNGEVALEKFESSKDNYYSCILMDIQMPIMNGYDATKAIRSSLHTQALTIPIFAMTANAFGDDVNKAISCGMNGHIAKPIDTSILYMTLSEILK